LPLFDEKQVLNEARSELGAPPPLPLKTPQEIELQATAEAISLMKKKYSSSFYNKKQMAIIEQYKPAKEGEEVTFLLMTTGKTVTGIYRGTLKDSRGAFIKVGYHQYRLIDINKKQLYLFLPAVANMYASKKITDWKLELAEKKKQYLEKVKGYKLNNYYINSGYKLQEGKWISESDIYQQKLDAMIKARKNKFTENIKEKQHEIFLKNKLFNLIDVSVSENANKTSEVFGEK
jgi:hypothetical protein